MGNLFEAWLDAEVAFLGTLFSGKSEDLPLLEGFVENGLALELTRNIDLRDFVDISKKIVYSKLIPTAWKLSTEAKPDPQPSSIVPMIL
jgi:hypothetical protein